MKIPLGGKKSAPLLPLWHMLWKGEVEVRFMCKQAIACILCIAGLVLLLFCFIPTWLICVLGILLLAAGIGLIVYKCILCK